MSETGVLNTVDIIFVILSKGISAAVSNIDNVSSVANRLFSPPTDAPPVNSTVSYKEQALGWFAFAHSIEPCPSSLFMILQVL
jgi:hypothetical protein